MKMRTGMTGRRHRRRRPAVEAMESRTLLAVTWTGYPLLPPPSLSPAPGSIAVGPDGDLWFTAVSAGPTSQIGRLVPATGAITFYAATADSTFSSIIDGPGGKLWFVDTAGTGAAAKPSLGSFDPATGTLALEPLPAGSGPPGSLAEGPDGKLWFTGAAAGAVGVFDPATRAIAEFPLPRLSSNPGGIVASGGLLWFTEAALSPSGSTFTGAISSIDPTTHAIHEYPTNHSPGSIAVGPDGDLWFSEIMPNDRKESLYLGQFDPASHALSETLASDSLSDTYGSDLTAGPDGRVWFTAGTSIGEIDPATKAVSLDPDPPSPVPDGDPYVAGALVTGPDRNLWVTAYRAYPPLGAIERATILPADRAAITGRVDVNDSGLASEMGEGLPGVTVYVDANGDGVLDAGDPAAITDDFGNYQITGVPPGAYNVRVAYPANITTFPTGGAQAVTVAGGDNVELLTFGVAPGPAVLPLAYSANPFGSHNPDVSTAEVVGLYNILLGHAPDATGEATAVAYLKGGGSLQYLAQVLTDTVDFDARVVAQDYLDFVGRAGTPDEIASWVSLMQHGYSAEQVAYLMLTSAGYNGLHPDDVSFLQALYTQVLGRQASGAEVAAWETYLAGSSRAAVVQQFVFGPAAMTRAVEGMSVVLWREWPDPNVVAYVVPFLTSGRLTLAQVATAFASSTDFALWADSTVG